MFKNFLLYFTFFVSIVISAQEIHTNEYKTNISLSDFHLNGKVKNILTTAKNINGEYATLPFFENELYNQILLEFNRYGLLDKQTNYLDYSGRLGVYSFVDYVYKDSKLVVGEKKTIINNGEDPKRIASDKKYIYANNNLVGLVEVLKNKSSSITNYETNFEYSNQLNKIVTKIEGKIISENNLTYNKNGLLVLNELTSFDGRKGNKTFFIYENDEPIFQQKIGGNINTVTFFDKNSLSKIQSFDSNKDLVYEASFNARNEIESIKKQYFKNGKSFLSDYEIKYSYDKLNNWILADVYEGSKLKYTINREINYY